MVEVWRGRTVESRHRGRAVVVDRSGTVVAAWGNVERAVFPRSSIKAVQALPLLESGAFAASGLSDPELALACASHGGESRHTRLAASWAEHIGANAVDLECGAHAPFDDEAAAELIRAGQRPSTLHNNCSGKHLGMLTTARHLGEPWRGYTAAEHPVQLRIRTAIEDMAGVDLAQARFGIDGCGIPTFPIPLSGLARAMARIADPQGLPSARVTAIRRIREAWGRHPYLIGGRVSFDTHFIKVAGGQVLVKSGAMGVATAAIPRLGLGLALKIEDGTAQARDVALAALLQWCGVLDPVRWAMLAEYTQPVLKNCSGLPVGALRPAPGWPGPGLSPGNGNGNGNGLGGHGTGSGA